jgi:hypothetical protein
MTPTAKAPTSGPIHALDGRRAYFNFLSHLRYAHGAGLRWPVECFAEIGTGTSLGVGFCALLTGAKYYIGFDAAAHMDPSAQSSVLSELRALFAERAPALNDAGEKAFDFPQHIVGAWAQPSDADIMSRVSYVAPYDSSCATRFAQSADLIMSTATLEHIDDMAQGYALFRAMLKPDGLMSHSIDFKSHGFGKGFKGQQVWNEHWIPSEAEWRELTKGRSYSINRLTCSQHLQLQIKAGFKPLLVNKRSQPTDVRWSDLAPRFQWMTAEDLACSGAHIISRVA